MIVRDNNIRITIDLIISKNVKAKEILTLKSEQPSIISYDINSMIDNNIKSLAKSNKSEIYKTINSISSDGISCTLPAISIVESNNTKVNKIDGIAIFKKDKLIGFLSDEESQYFLFITNRIKKPVISTRVNNKENLYICAEIFENKTLITPNYKNNEISFNIKTKTTVSINDIETYTNYADISEYRKLENVFENYLQNNIKNLVQKVQKDYGCDIFGFGQVVYQKNPKTWAKYKSNWDDMFKNLKISVNSEFIIRDSGTINNTIKNGA